MSKINKMTKVELLADNEGICRILQDCMEKNTKLNLEINKLYNENENIKTEINLLNDWKKNHICPDVKKSKDYIIIEESINKLNLYNRKLKQENESYEKTIKNYNKVSNILNKHKIENIDDLIDIIENFKKYNIIHNNKIINNNIEKGFNVLENIINNYKTDNIDLELSYDNNEEKIDIHKYYINKNNNSIYSNKSDLIYNYYEIYKIYLDKKNNNAKLYFEDFIKHNYKDNGLYVKKIEISYEFFSDLLNIANNIKNRSESEKIYILKEILKKCRLSINKLYKIKENSYKELIDFLKPIILEKCKKNKSY